MQKSFAKALDINRLKDWGIQAAKAITAFGMECVNAASDLQEVQNVVDVTFGNSAAEIDAWAKTAINQFGLSETKAKQFASTLGAMMKSAGLAGSEVVEMSEALSGLAADMSSFYNLDFDTAFQKIRSGISGETEPLKQLGINMSQANLQAFALEKGITKALDKMSQGEMVMLRYQYLMQATADAQGDFARTSDGYANSVRLLQSNLESIKTKIGSVFIGVLADATTSLNNFITKMTQAKPRTVLDDFADIDLKTAEKLAQIEETAGKAGSLIGTLEDISSQVINYQRGGNLATFISSLSGNITGLDTALAKAKEGNVEGALDDLAQALAKDLGGDPEKWKNLLQAVGNNAGLAIEATKGDTGKTKTFLEKVAASADDLTTDYSTYWANLLGALGDNAGDAIKALSGGENVGGTIAAIAKGANDLKDGTSGKWSAFSKALGLLDEHGNVPTTLQGVASALATNLGGDASKWETMLQAISNNLGDVTTAVENDGDLTAGWLTAAAQAADDLGGDYSENWKKLLVVYGEKAGDAIKALDTTSNPGAVLSGIAGGANALENGTSNKWSEFASALGILDGKENIPTTLQGVANALKTKIGGDPKKWEDILKAIGDNAEAAIEATKGDTDKTQSFLEHIAAGADDLTADYSPYWEELLEVLGDDAEEAISALANGSDAGEILTSIAEGATAVSESANDNDPGTILSGIATGANKLAATSPFIWNSLLTALKNVNGLENIFSNSNAGKNVQDLANALSGNSPDVTKAEAWKTFLGALSENPDALTTLTQTDAEATAQWLETMADAVNQIEPGDADSWSNLFTYFVQGLPGLNDTEGGHAFFEAIAQEFLAMGSESDIAREGLLSLGLTSDQVDEAQKEWLETCKRLVQTLPGLNNIINTQTGEVKGGTEAVQNYVKEWEEAQRAMIIIDSLAQKERALIMQYDMLPSLKVDVRNAKKNVDELRKILEEAHPDMRFNPDGTILDEGTWNYAEIRNYIEALDDLQGKQEELDRNQTAFDQASNRLKEEKEAAQELVDKFGDLTNSANNAGKATSNIFSPEVAQAIAKAVDDTEKAVKAMKDYSDQVYKSSLSSIEGTLGGFSKIYDSIEAAKQNVQKLQKEWENFEGTGDAEKDSAKRKELHKIWKDAENAIPSIQNLNEALDTQVKFLSDYYDNLERMRQLGYSDEVIAMVSGGSAEDAGNAKALANTRATDPRIKEINDKVATIKKKSKELAGSMTENKLTIDEQFKDLEKTAAEAIAGLSQYDEAKKNVTTTMQGIIDGLNDTQSTVKSQVQNILDMLAQLSGASYNVPNFNFNTGTFGPVNPNLTVYTHLNLDGKQVATSVSEHQGNSLRTAQRSGGAVK